MMNKLYQLYDYIGAQIYHTGIVRKTGLSTLAAKLDVMLRRSMSTAATSPIVLNGLEVHCARCTFLQKDALMLSWAKPESMSPLLHNYFTAG
jgi:hypothetical protein